MKTKTIDVKIDELTIAPENVRTTPATEAEDAALRDSLKSVGRLYVPLIAYHSKGVYYVCAGGRRTTQLKSLAEAGELPSTLETVPVSVIARKDATEASSIENIQRVGMSPFDTAMAIGDLRAAGKSDKVISVTLGQPLSTVRSLSAFSSLPAEVIELVRSDQLTLSAALRLGGLPSDRVLTIATLVAEKYYPNAQEDRVKSMLNSERASSTDRRVLFVGLDAYLEAGGQTESDLVDDTVYISDTTLLNTLYEQKLSAITEVDGLPVDEVNADVAAAFSLTVPPSYSRVPFIKVAKPGHEDEYKEVQEAFDAADSAIDSVHAGDLEVDEDRWEELHDEYRKADARLRDLTTSIPDPEQLAQSHRVAYVNDKGELQMAGFMPPVEVEPSEETSGPISDGALGKPDTYTHSLQSDLARTRLLIKRNRIASDPGLAFDTLAFSMALDLFNNSFWGRPLSQSFTDHDCRSSVGESFAFYDAAPYQKWFDLSDQIDMSWVVRGDHDILDVVASFKAFRSLPIETRQTIFAFGVGTMQRDSSCPEFDDYLTHDVDFAEEYRPDQTFFNRINAAQIRSTFDEVGASDLAESLKSAKKRDLVDTAHRLFTGTPTAGISEDVARNALRWVPKGIQYVEPSSDADDSDAPEAAWLEDTAVAAE